MQVIRKHETYVYNIKRNTIDFETNSV